VSALPTSSGKGGACGSRRRKLKKGNESVKAKTGNVVVGRDKKGRDNEEPKGQLRVAEFNEVWRCVGGYSKGKRGGDFLAGGVLSRSSQCRGGKVGMG